MVHLGAQLALGQFSYREEDPSVQEERNKKVSQDIYHEKARLCGYGIGLR
jgi:hypothetical protein